MTTRTPEAKKAKANRAGAATKPVAGALTPGGDPAVALNDPGRGPIAASGEATLQRLRERIVKDAFAPGSSILEIGPSHEPTLPRSAGYDTYNADHTDRQGLIEKYETHEEVDASRIEDVHYVLTPGLPLSECVDRKFDVVMAAHVLEHTPSLVDFVNDCTSLLTDHGVLVLIVPDHRFCFDRFRERSSLGAIIDAMQNRTGMHTRGTLTEMALLGVRRRGRIAWSPKAGGPYEMVHPPEHARDILTAPPATTYEDTHNWVFTPHHLRLLLHDLAGLELINLRESMFANTVGCEFYLTLAVDGPGPGVSRSELLARADAERRQMDAPVFVS